MVTPRVERLVTLAICAAAIAIRFWLGPYVTDDAYITFRYSENLARGSGFTYNPPERVQGTTAPLVALLLTIPAASRMNLGWTMLVVSGAADVATILCGASMLSGAGWRIAGLLFGVAVALWPGFVRYSVSGLETSLYAALLMLSCFCADRGRGVVAGFVLALVSLCRPDGALLALVLLPMMWRRRPAGARRAFIGYVCTLLPWGLFTLSYFHTVIPASVAAKVHTRLPAAESVRAFGVQFWGGMYSAVTPIAAAGAWCLARRAGQIFLAMGLWWIAYASIFIITGAFGPYPWYFVPLLPVYFMCIGTAVEQAIRLVWPRSITTGVALMPVVVAAVILGSRTAALRSTLDAWFREREYLYRDVAANILTRQDCTLAATEIGALGYFYSGRILDLVGLVSPEVTRQPLGDVFAAQTPCWVVSYDTHLPPDLVRSAVFTDSYSVVFRQRVGPERELLVFGRK